MHDGNNLNVLFKQINLYYFVLMDYGGGHYGLLKLKRQRDNQGRMNW